jgi:hypothetical protein
MRDLIKRNANAGLNSLELIRGEGCNERSGLQPEQNQAFQRCEHMRTEQGWKTEKPAMKRSGMRALATYVGTTQGLARVDAFENANFCKSNFATTLDSPQPAATRR